MRSFIVQMVTARFVTIDGHEGVPQYDEMSLKKAVAHQPISVMIEANDMKLYKSVIDTLTKKLDYFFIYIFFYFKTQY